MTVTGKAQKFIMREQMAAELGLSVAASALRAAVQGAVRPESMSDSTRRAHLLGEDCGPERVGLRGVAAPPHLGAPLVSNLDYGCNSVAKCVAKCIAKCVAIP